MLRSKRIRCDDAAKVVQIVGECLELWDDPPAWQERLLIGLGEITQTHINTLVVVANSDPLDVLHHWGDERLGVGFAGPQEAQYFYRAPCTDMHDMPGTDRINRALATTGKATFLRQQFCSYRDYERTEAHQLWRRPGGAGDYMAAMRIAPAAGVILVMAPSRILGSGPVPEKSAPLADLLLDQITPLVGTRLALTNQRSRQGLSPRLRQTLDLLLCGLGEKQVARTLNLSQATVHDYVGELYRHFAVSSRAELLAYFVHRRPSAKPPS